MRIHRTVLSFASVFFALGIAVLSTTQTSASQSESAAIESAISLYGHDWVAKENHISSLPADVRRMRLGAFREMLPAAEPLEVHQFRNLSVTAAAQLPTALDWRNYGGVNYVTAVRDQGHCASCWAFATAAAVESVTNIANGVSNLDLSEQILVSCSGAGSCSGGYIDQASEFIRATGLPTETYDPYSAKNASCAAAASGWQNITDRIASWRWVTTTSPTVDALRTALYAYGPLVTTMDIFTDFYYYNGGIYKHTFGTPDGGHAIMLVGYDNAGGYFIAKNSWGSVWGESGYFRIGYSELTSPVHFGDYTIAYTVTPRIPITGSLTINGGAPATNKAAVTLTVSTDNSTVSQMCISNTTTCSSWVAFAATKSWTLSTGGGTKTVYTWLRDNMGNVSTTPFSASIIIDTAIPGNGIVTAAGGDAQTTLSWSGFSDAGSGVAGYLVVYATKSAPAKCSSGTVVYAGSASSFVHAGLTNGTTYYYRVCATDVAGNVSTGTTTSARCLPETTPPTGTIAINGGAPATNKTAVTLTLSATDPSGVSQMCISNTTTCSSWIAYAENKKWSIASGSGTRTVYVWFKDSWGTANTTPFSASITLDTAAPANGTLSATGGSKQTTLTWSGFSDAGSGLAGYKVVYASKSTPANCNSGTEIYTGSDSEFLHSGLTNGAKYYYRVCATDNAGNTSTGVTASATPK